MGRVIWSERPFFEAGCRPMMWFNRVTHERRPYYCNSARCHRKECVENWARRRMAIANGLISKYGLTRFFTLTVDRSMSLSEAWDSIHAWWKVFRDKVRYYLSKTERKLQYFAVLEAHKDGYPHIHGFWNVFVRQKYIAKMWSESAPGKMVHVKAIEDSKSASDYLGLDMGKYLGKDQSVKGARNAKHRQRTFWRSQGMKTEFELDRESKIGYTDWELVKERYNGKTKRTRQDMEGTCCAIPEEVTIGSVQEVDSAKSEGATMQEARSVHRQERQSKHRDQEAKRGGSVYTQTLGRQMTWLREADHT